ncbi:uncharacterized protein ColSpa_06688 [Colletotrichum spaethianum]|uniref:Uncharacterized protein n=1 Tax=Colletotrichum spaethianum TaxID=700344 RepID=A0AA37NYS0_9PEZI|nr:uncharacterized protein ColSpa_06688 [Colletotrichum spaethianum]GKT46507.1 hypothetical protein ColSpa_06688 [Colletotrichum spaethianum]
MAKKAPPNRVAYEHAEIRPDKYDNTCTPSLPEIYMLLSTNVDPVTLQSRERDGRADDITVRRKVLFLEQKKKGK